MFNNFPDKSVTELWESFPKEQVGTIEEFNKKLEDGNWFSDHSSYYDEGLGEHVIKGHAVMMLAFLVLSTGAKKDSNKAKTEILTWEEFNPNEKYGSGVYAIELPTGTKIGKSSNLNKRIKTHLNAVTNYSTDNAGRIYIAKCNNVDDWEKILHEKFSSTKIKQEIFNISIDEVVNVDKS